MANEREFAMVNDQSGSEEMVTLDTMADCQARGFRLVDVNGYSTAMQEREDERRAAALAAVPELPDHNAERIMADALLVARRTYPGVQSNDPSTRHIKPGEDTRLTGSATGVAPNEELNLDTATIQEMRDYGAANNVDLSGAKLRADYVAAIEESRAAQGTGGADSDADTDEE